MSQPIKQCCPEGFFYVNINGYYYDPISGLTLVTNSFGSSPTFTEVIDKCVMFANRGFGQSPQTADDCPCCPQGYTYSQASGGCCPGTGTGLCKIQDLISPIPCLPCICVDPPPLPPCDTCDQAEGLPITFQYQSDVKQCTDCVPQDFILTTDPKLNCFAPYFLIQPNINFKLD